ncbi:hypothetical protein HMPREF6485_0088 [Segatella buccae ATCC 33574]|uniref:Uncharacterized protein n=1 Tax=Segatella buccae ATCC 33574 TaxID=873513 RepID=E6K3A3_9BACT|nr:hypothetical protein HMPREF6485_0088 [Segatella buccae ATCC 33574]
MKRKMKNLFSNKSLSPKKDTAKDSKRTFCKINKPSCRFYKP